MNLLDNSSAASASAPPTLSGGATRSTALGRTDTTSWILRGFKGTVLGVPTTVTSSLTWSTVTLTFGTTYDVEVYHNGVSATPDANLLVEVDKGDGSFVTLGTMTSVLASSDFQRWDLGSFVATGTAGRFRCRVPAPTANGESFWVVDDVRLAEASDVAIRLSERAVDEVVSILTTNLGTELAAIDTERADSVTVPVPPSGAYYKRPKAEIIGGTAHVEVYEGSFAFANPYVDQDSQRAVTEVPITIRVTCYRRANESADTMTKYRRRYAAGVLNTFIQNTTYSDDAVQRVIVEDVRFDEDYAEDGALLKVQTTLSAKVKMEEVYA